ncbi:diaminopimelate epimerase [Nonomuraea basaltis]|uniref:diaminopimelate epimerase n=1 Tax=Nonomuraea basaltis TaxID=2495887 RepID=UPI00110C4292|nr:diaminopimelate epimerase [Nonomuraea basaltis]TMR90410.1 diaminopimelate epimerase [Nonomuraea basaltis]
MSRPKVAKTHGSRNIILVADGAPDDHFTAAELPRAVQRLCAWKGGSDGIYFVKDAADGAVDAWFFNPDGSPALLCGNGMRAAGRLMLDRHQADEMVLRTGPYAFTVRAAESTAQGVRQVAVELPAVDFTPHDPIVAGVAWPYVDQANPAYSPQRTVTALAVPNSHLITLVDRYDEDELIATGSRVADDSANFPIGANVSCVQRLGEDEVYIRTFERGAGLTESCGSGVSASRATLSRLGLADPDARVLVRNPGGPSHSWLQQTGDVWQPVLEGNATVILRTEVDTADVLGGAPLDFAGEAFTDEIEAFDALFQDNLTTLRTSGINPAVA